MPRFAGLAMPKVQTGLASAVGAACDTLVGAGTLYAGGEGPEVGKREVDGDSTLPTVEGMLGPACETVVGA